MAAAREALSRRDTESARRLIAAAIDRLQQPAPPVAAVPAAPEPLKPGMAPPVPYVAPVPYAAPAPQVVPAPQIVPMPQAAMPVPGKPPPL